MRRHFRIGPTKHSHHHLALGAVGICGNPGTRFADPMTVFFGSLTAKTVYFLNFAAQDFLFIGRTRPLTCSRTWKSGVFK